MDTELKEVYVPVPCPHIVWYLEKRCDFALFFFFSKNSFQGVDLIRPGSQITNYFCGFLFLFLGFIFIFIISI